MDVQKIAEERYLVFVMFVRETWKQCPLKFRKKVMIYREKDRIQAGDVCIRLFVYRGRKGSALPLWMELQKYRNLIVGKVLNRIINKKNNGGQTLFIVLDHRYF